MAYCAGLPAAFHGILEDPMLTCSRDGRIEGGTSGKREQSKGLMNTLDDSGVHFGADDEEEARRQRKEKRAETRRTNEEKREKKARRRAEREQLQGMDESSEKRCHSPSENDDSLKNKRSRLDEGHEIRLHNPPGISYPEKMLEVKREPIEAAEAEEREYERPDIILLKVTTGRPTASAHHHQTTVVKEEKDPKCQNCIVLQEDCRRLELEKREMERSFVADKQKLEEEHASKVQRMAERIHELELDLEFANCLLGKSRDDVMTDSIRLEQTKVECKRLAGEHLNSVKEATHFQNLWKRSESERMEEAGERKRLRQQLEQMKGLEQQMEEMKQQIAQAEARAGDYQLSEAKAREEIKEAERDKRIKDVVIRVLREDIAMLQSSKPASSALDGIKTEQSPADPAANEKSGDNQPPPEE